MVLFPIIYNMPIPLSQTSSLVLICDKNTSYQSSKSKEFLSHLDLSKGREMYNKIRHLKPHLDEIIPNRKFLIHNYIRKILKKNKFAQVLSLACGWDPILVKMSEEFPRHSFFGVDSESIQTQEKLIQKIMPHSPIVYLNEDIINPKQLIQKLTAKGWKKDQPTGLVLEGISYYIPPKPFWKSLKILKQNITADCFICGDFLIDWTQQKISKISQNLGFSIFNMIKESCSQNYYSITTKQIQKNLEDLAFSNIQFFTQDEIQKQRKGKTTPWKKKEGPTCLFTAQNKTPHSKL